MSAASLLNFSNPNIYILQYIVSSLVVYVAGDDVLYFGQDEVRFLHYDKPEEACRIVKDHLTAGYFEGKSSPAVKYFSLPASEQLSHFVAKFNTIDKLASALELICVRAVSRNGSGRARKIA